MKALWHSKLADSQVVYIIDIVMCIVEGIAFFMIIIFKVTNQESNNTL